MAIINVPPADCLIVGEITSIEGHYEGNVLHTTLRGYEKIHRLQRVKRTRTWANASDSDIVMRICLENGIVPGDVDPPTVVHPYVAQVAQTDWDFLRARAFETGCEVGMEVTAPGLSTLFFRTASGSGASDAIAAANPLAGAAVNLGDNLMWFKPRVSSMALTPEVEVRAYDPVAADVVVGKASVDSGTSDVAGGAADHTGDFDGPFVGIPMIPLLVPNLPGVSKNPSDTAHITYDRPAAWGSTTSRALDSIAAGVAEHLGSTYAEAEGYARGSSSIKPGEYAKVGGVPEDFAGAWMVTQARHLFEGSEGGYWTHFTVAGRNDRSLLGLAAAGAVQPDQPRIDGFVVGIVTNNQDPDKLWRVKVMYPWLHSAFESDWARCVQIGAGKEWGDLHVPEVGDEVLVGFEFGDMRRPYVVGGLRNGKSKIDLGAEPVKVSVPTAEVVARGYVSRSGHRLVFDDDEKPLPTKSGIRMGTKDEKLHIFLDKAEATVRIVCDDPNSPKPAKIVIEQNSSAPGSIEITQKGVGGKITVKSDGDVSVEAGAAGALSLKGGSKGVSVETHGQLELKGTMVVTVFGATVKLG
jgi:hypothetical protein